MNKFVRISVQVCQGVLSGWWWQEESKLDAYYAVSGSPGRTNDASRFVTYERDGTETHLRSVDDLLMAIRGHGCLPPEEVEKDPLGFAVVTGFLLNLAEGERVIEGATFLRFLDEEFDITMSSLVPRLKDGQLEFSILVRAPNNTFQM